MRVQGTRTGRGPPHNLWQKSNRAAKNGTTIVNSVAVSSGNSWHIVATADFDGDGHPDLLWQDPVQTDQAAANTWQVKAAADFKLDGQADRVWQDPAAGSAQIWYLGGGRAPTLLSAVAVSAATS